MTTLLIGGTGFLGAHVAQRLVRRGPLAVLARPSSDCSVLPPGCDIRVGDLSQPPDLHDITSVAYCASMGFGHVPSLVRNLERASVERAVFVSTTAIFTSLPAPSRLVRLAAEDAVTSSALAWTILRPTMIYGTGRDRNISRLLRALRRWPVFPVPATPALWQPIHVDDLADAVVAALDAPKAAGKAYNLAGAAPLTFAALVHAAARAVNRAVRLLPVPLPLLVGAARLTRVVTPEQVRRLAEDKAFDWHAAEADLGFAPRRFEDGVRQEATLLKYRATE
jgi:nucleoside-diphosphate-sugar epimerase